MNKAEMLEILDMEYDDMMYDNGGELEDFDYNKCYMEWKYPGILEEMDYICKMNDYE